MNPKHKDNPCEESSEFDFDKFKNFLHYIISKTNNHCNVGKTVLFKILYFTDFNYYELFEEKLSGETYLKYPYGPAPCDFDVAILALKKEGSIKEIESNYGTYRQIKYSSNSEPDTSKFSKDDLEFIDKSVSTYSKFNATKISDYSHKDTPYVIAEDFKELDYELVFYRDPSLSVRVYDDEQ